MNFLINTDNNGREIKPTQMLCMITMNIVVATKPLYKVDEGLIEYLDDKAQAMKNYSYYFFLLLCYAKT